MTWSIKTRPHVAGSPLVAEYECPVHGRFERTVQRDAGGDPPAEVPCAFVEIAEHWYVGPIGETVMPDVADVGNHCGRSSPWRISAPQLKRDSVPCYAAVRGGDTERRPGMLDTRPLAEGMSSKEWKAKQIAARHERRHHELIAKGLKTKRVQV